MLINLLLQMSRKVVSFILDLLEHTSAYLEKLMILQPKALSSKLYLLEIL